MPSNVAASEIACAWLPDENATTPARRCRSSNRESALNAPRNLNAPMRWKFSHLKKSVAPVSASAVRDVRTGVRCACPAMRAAAAATSPYSGNFSAMPAPATRDGISWWPWRTPGKLSTRRQRALPHSFVQADRGRCGDVERLAAARLGDREHCRATRREGRAEPLPLVAEGPGARPGQRDLVDAALGVRAGAEQRQLERRQHLDVDALDETEREVRAHAG